MTSLVTILEAVAAGALFFFVPGYLIAKALFPEWRVRGPGGTLIALQLVALGFVLSVVLTVLVGYILLVGSPTGFAANWSNPVLESVLATVGLVAGLVGWARGAFGRVPPPRPAPERTDDGEQGAWELMVELDRLRRDERRTLHALRTTPAGSPEAARLGETLTELRAQMADLAREREAEYAR